MDWRSYTAPVPFVVDGDYQVPYYARYFEEIMHNINVAEEALDLPATTWYRYSPASAPEVFVPLQGGQQQLVGFDPHYAEYILRMREALVDIWSALGASKSKVLQSRFGYTDWAHPEGFDVQKQQFSDRDIEELRFEMPSITVSLMYRSQWISARGYGICELPDEYGEATEEEKAEMEAQALEAAWNDARQEAWAEYLDTRTYAWYTAPPERLERWWRAEALKRFGAIRVNTTIHFWGPAVYILFQNIPDYLQGQNWVTGKLTYLARVVGEHPSPVRLWAHVESFDHTPVVADLRDVLDASPPNLGRGSEEVGHGDWREVTVLFELTDAEEHLLIGLGLDSPIAFVSNPLPMGCPVEIAESIVVGPQTFLNEYSFDFECFMFGRGYTA